MRESHSLRLIHWAGSYFLTDLCFSQFEQNNCNLIHNTVLEDDFQLAIKEIMGLIPQEVSQECSLYS